MCQNEHTSTDRSWIQRFTKYGYISYIWDILELFCLLLHPQKKYWIWYFSLGPCQDLLTIFLLPVFGHLMVGEMKRGESWNSLSFQPFFEPINLLSTYHHCNVYHWLLIFSFFTNFSSTYLCLPREQLASPLLGLVEEPRVLLFLQQLLLRSTSHIWNNNWTPKPIYNW